MKQLFIFTTIFSTIFYGCKTSKSKISTLKLNPQKNNYVAVDNSTLISFKSNSLELTSSSNTIIESLFSRMDTSYSFLKNYIFLISPKSCKDESKASCNEAGVTILMVPW